MVCIVCIVLDRFIAVFEKKIITARKYCFSPRTSPGLISIRMTFFMGLSEGRAYLQNILSRARFIKEILFSLLKMVSLSEGDYALL